MKIDCLFTITSLDLQYYFKGLFSFSYLKVFTSRYERNDNSHIYVRIIQ